MVTTDNPRYKRNPVIPLSHHHYGLGNRACVLTCVPCLCLQYWPSTAPGRTCFHLRLITQWKILHLQWWHPLRRSSLFVDRSVFLPNFAHLILNCPLRNAHGPRSPLHLSEKPSRQLSATNHNFTTHNGSKHKRDCSSSFPINSPWSPPPPQFMSDLGWYCQYTYYW